MAAQDVALKHGRYYDAARDGRLFHAQTAAAGVAPGTAIGTTAPFALHNPLGSGVYVAINIVSMGYVSGTLGAGTIHHCVNLDPQAAAPTGTTIVERPGLVTGAGSQAIALTTATLAAAPTPWRQFISLAPELATSVLAPYIAYEDVGGAIILPPGCTYSPQGTLGAGTSPLVVFGVTWEEIATDAD